MWHILPLAKKNDYALKWQGELWGHPHHLFLQIPKAVAARIPVHPASRVTIRLFPYLRKSQLIKPAAPIIRTGLSLVKSIRAKATTPMIAVGME